MAYSILDAAGRRAALFLGCALVAGAPPWAATTHNAQAPINLEAASTDFDYRNNTLLFRRVILYPKADNIIFRVLCAGGVHITQYGNIQNTDRKIVKAGSYPFYLERKCNSLEPFYRSD